MGLLNHEGSRYSMSNSYHGGGGGGGGGGFSGGGGFGGGFGGGYSHPSPSSGYGSQASPMYR